ncbi:EpsG family protein [Pseudomonadota bacterium]
MDTIKIVIRKDTYSKISDLSFFLFLIFLFFNLYNAKDGFSYDYQFYLSYLEQISVLEPREIFSLTTGPYVFLKLSSGIEFGFVFLTKILSYFFTVPHYLYFMLVLISISMKYYVFRKMNVGILWVIPILLLSFILLEGNALRSALALSFYLFGVFYYNQRKLLLGTLYFLLSVCFHLQALFFILTYYSVFTYFRYFNCNRRTVFILFTGIFFSGGILSFVVGSLGFEKLDFYSQSKSGSNGINLISVLSIISLFVYLVCLLSRRISLRYNELLLLCSSIPALSIYVFVTNVAVLGDRLWQWGIILMYASMFARFSERRFFINMGTVKLSSVFPFVLLAVFLINIILRYPLTNIFQFILGYYDYSVGF